jgi:hypothetical protein
MLVMAVLLQVGHGQPARVLHHQNGRAARSPLAAVPAPDSLETLRGIPRKTRDMLDRFLISLAKRRDGKPPSSHTRVLEAFGHFGFLEGGGEFR